jgi:hypothetical protein
MQMAGAEVLLPFLFIIVDFSAVYQKNLLECLSVTAILSEQRSNLAAGCFLPASKL